MKNKVLIYLFILVITLLPIHFAAADFSSVFNKININSNTGGNIIENGEVEEGESKSTVYIYTEIDGEVIEDEYIESTSSEVYIESKHYINEEGEDEGYTKVDFGKPAIDLQSDEIIPEESESNTLEEPEAQPIDISPQSQNLWQIIINFLKNIFNLK